MADCQMICDPDCEVAPEHCWNHHRPSHKPDWHDPAECDQRAAADELTRLGEELDDPAGGPG